MGCFSYLYNLLSFIEKIYISISSKIPNVSIATYMNYPVCLSWERLKHFFSPRSKAYNLSFSWTKTIAIFQQNKTKIIFYTRKGLVVWFFFSVFLICLKPKSVLAKLNPCSYQWKRSDSQMQNKKNKFKNMFLSDFFYRFRWFCPKLVNLGYFN